MSSTNENQPRRKRSITLLALGWLAERMRKTEEVKQAITSGTYRVDAEKVAEAIIHPPADGP